MDDVLVLHRTQIHHFGGAPGIRDAGLIEAVLARPQTGFYGDLIKEAAALLENMTMNHGFIKGNKRVGFAATYVFLRINGLDIKASERTTLKFVIGMLESGSFLKDELDAWLRRHTRMSG
ncbi:MAG: type II toxin-antitoxin system death-on-curing family toxin [Pseudomonadales bacterium]|nr:type II toxin-antitoxin system death-on-curing family toxin [Pseudomonadales bacterium]